MGNEKAGHQNLALQRQGPFVLGFTGSRVGMTAYQKDLLHQLLADLEIAVAHHGDCVGSDAEFHAICREHKIPIVIHPPTNPKWRAFCTGWAMIEKPLPYLDRDKVIVNVCDLLLAAPKEDEEPTVARGQGTWSTVRYARKSERLLRILWPQEV